MRTGIALGSNLGDRLSLLRAGRDFLRTLHHVPAPLLASAVYETAPVGCPPGSLPFLNAVIEIVTDLAPSDLLLLLSGFEGSLGRPGRRPRNSPRPLDLDILYCGDASIASADLTLPHPRINQRRFVLQPLADIRPDLVLPGQSSTVAQLLAALPPGPAVTFLAAEW